MNTSTATAKTLLRQAWPRVCGGQAGRLVPHDLDVLFKYALVPRASACPSRKASCRFRDEPS
ncbi:MAG: hypothetical protein KF682_09040 [Nitrospira sp.]|nr:hypothetical protein [Nitrospira sp.]